ncbi:hypothetical protein AGMMS50239_32820 [Bacteroidia bacterium]|nr:hypothetical protein AGMMS50239_32820 [Bacteroidia bacterium]
MKCKKYFYYFYILLTACSIVSCQPEESDPDSGSQGNGNGETTTKGTGGIVGLITDVSSHKAIDGVYVLLMPVGKVNSGTGSDGRYQFDNLQAKSDYKLNAFKEGYIREEKTISVTAGKTTTDEGNIGLHKKTGTISISKTFIDMGTTGIGAVFSISTGENNNLSWKIIFDREWLTVDHQTGIGNSAINITLDRNKLSSVREDNHAVITVASTSVGDGSYDELWVTVFGTGNGVNVGNISTQDAINVTTNSASVTSRVLNSGIQHDERGICYSKTPNPTIQNFVERDSKIGTGIYTVTLKDLSAGTTYYARAYAINNTTGNAYYGNEISFTTKSSAPSVSVPEITNTTANTAVFQAKITNSGAPKYTECGFVYSESPEPKIENAIKKLKADKITNTDFSANAIDLKANTSYYVRAYAINDNDTVYSINDKKFITNGIKTELTILPSTNVSASSAVLNALVMQEGAPTYTARGFCYISAYGCSSSSLPYSNDNPTSVTTTDFSKEVPLDYNTTYIVRAYVIQNGNVIYSNNKVCFTTVWKDADVSTYPVTDLGTTTATLKGRINDVGIPAYSERGFCYLPTTSSYGYVVPDISDNPTPAEGIGIMGDFEKKITKLESNKSYVVRAYAKQVTGEDPIYGEVQEFTTKDELFVTIGNLGVQKTDITSVPINWNTANANCSGSTLGGKQWRLPTIEELRVIHDYANRYPNKLGGFAEYEQNNYYWYIDFPAYWSSDVGNTPNVSTHKIKFFDGTGDEDVMKDDLSVYKYNSGAYEHRLSMHCRCVCNSP